MRPFEKGEKVRFMAYSLFTGDHEVEGTVEGEARAWIEANKNRPEIDAEEYAGLEEDEAYIVKTKDVYGNTQRHLVYVGDMIAVLPSEEEKEI